MSYVGSSGSPKQMSYTRSSVPLQPVSSLEVLALLLLIRQTMKTRKAVPPQHIPTAVTELAMILI